MKEMMVRPNRQVETGPLNMSEAIKRVMLKR